MLASLSGRLLIRKSGGHTEVRRGRFCGLDCPTVRELRHGGFKNRRRKCGTKPINQQDSHRGSNARGKIEFFREKMSYFGPRGVLAGKVIVVYSDLHPGNGSRRSAKARPGKISRLWVDWKIAFFIASEGIIKNNNDLYNLFHESPMRLSHQYPATAE